MGRKAVDPANAFSIRVLHEIEQARADSGIPQRDMFEQAGMSANYFYKRLRGEAPLNTNDVHNLAAAIGHDAIFIMQRAAGSADTSEHIAPVIDGGFGQNAEPTDLQRAAFEDDGDDGSDLDT